MSAILTNRPDHLASEPADLILSSLPVNISHDQQLSTHVVHLRNLNRYAGFVEHIQIGQPIRHIWTTDTFDSSASANLAAGIIAKAERQRLGSLQTPQLTIVQNASEWEHLPRCHGHFRAIIGTDGYTWRVGVEFIRDLQPNANIQWDSQSFPSLASAQDNAIAILDRRQRQLLPIKQDHPAFLVRPQFDGQFRIVRNFGSASHNVCDQAQPDNKGKLHWIPLTDSDNTALAALRGFTCAQSIVQQDLIDTFPFTQAQFLQIVANRTASIARCLENPRDLDALNSTAVAVTQDALEALNMPVQQALNQLCPETFSHLSAEHQIAIADAQSLIGICNRIGSGVVPESLFTAIMVPSASTAHEEITDTLCYYRPELLSVVSGLPAPVARALADRASFASVDEEGLLTSKFAAWPADSDRQSIVNFILSMSGQPIAELQNDPEPAHRSAPALR